MNTAYPVISQFWEQVCFCLGSLLLQTLAPFTLSPNYRFGFGPLVWAPLSEVYGRKWPTVAPCFIAALFSFATAVSMNIRSIIVTRFFCGFFGAAPIICTGGAFADMWDATQRGNAIVGYALAVAAGPVRSTIRMHLQLSNWAKDFWTPRWGSNHCKWAFMEMD